jgi:hypothetical protein
MGGMSYSWLVGVSAVKLGLGFLLSSSRSARA